MKQFWKIFKLTLNYKKTLIASILFNLLTVVFSLVSVGVLSPILRIIFSTSEEVYANPSFQSVNNIDSFKSYIGNKVNYEITQANLEIGPAKLLAIVLGVTALLFLLKNVFRYLASIAITFIKNSVEKDIRNTMHTKVLHLPMNYFSDQKKGDLISRFTSDVSDIQWAVLTSIQKLIQAPLTIIFTLVVLFLMIW